MCSIPHGRWDRCHECDYLQEVGQWDGATAIEQRSAHPIPPTDQAALQAWIEQYRAIQRSEGHHSAAAGRTMGRGRTGLPLGYSWQQSAIVQAAQRDSNQVHNFRYPQELDFSTTPPGEQISPSPTPPSLVRGPQRTTQDPRNERPRYQSQRRDARNQARPWPEHATQAAGPAHDAVRRSTQHSNSVFPPHTRPVIDTALRGSPSAVVSRRRSTRNGYRSSYPDERLMRATTGQRYEAATDSEGEESD